MLINQTVLMSGADFFSNQFAINAHMNSGIAVNKDIAQREHTAIRDSLRSAGVTVKQVLPPKDCQDGVYTANWGLCRGDTAILSSLPNKRKNEEVYAESILKSLGKKTTRVPDNMRFSGQGDALPCGKYLFAGTEYRTDFAVHDFIAQTLGYEVISLQTVPKKGFLGLKTKNNKTTGWPDSFFYDLDLALAVLKYPSDSSRGLIAWCPEAFTTESRKRLESFDEVDKIEVGLHEAKEGLALNLVSTGEVVVMSHDAPEFQYAVESAGFRTITPRITELRKGGGFIRCTSLTLDNY